MLFTVVLGGGALGSTQKNGPEIRVHRPNGARYGALQC